MLFDLALPTAPIRTQWVALAGDQSPDGDDWEPGEKAIYDKLIAKGVSPAMAKIMCKKAVVKAKSTEAARSQSGVSLAAVPTNLRTDAREEAADKGEAMPDGSFPIRSLAELDKARQAFGRVSPDKADAVKRFMLKRARALGASQDVIDAISKYGRGDSDGDDDGD